MGVAGRGFRLELHGFSWDTIVTAQQILDDARKRGFGCYKYVRMPGEYRFLHIFTDHDTIVRDSERHLVISAGRFYIDLPDEFKIDNTASMTLKVGPKPEDGPAIRTLLGIP